MKELFFIPALIVLASVNLYSLSRMDELKVQKSLLEARLEATQDENERLTQQILGMLSNK